MPKAPRMIGTTLDVGSLVEFKDDMAFSRFTVKFLHSDAALIEDADGQLGLVHPSWLRLAQPWEPE